MLCELFKEILGICLRFDPILVDLGNRISESVNCFLPFNQEDHCEIKQIPQGQIVAQVMTEATIDVPGVINTDAMTMLDN